MEIIYNKNILILKTTSGKAKISKKERGNKMLSIVKSMSLLGLDGCLISVQVDVSGGLPGWETVGLPDTSVKEAKERVRTAIKNSGYELHSRKIVINLAPADTKKEGSIYDLPIAVGILVCQDIITEETKDDTLFIGELSLDGRVNKARKIQLERYKGSGIYSNAELSPKLINKYCRLDEESKEILKNAFEKLGLSARAYGRILKVARTIADLKGKENIETGHIAEAIQYRSLDKKYWKN